MASPCFQGRENMNLRLLAAHSPFFKLQLTRSRNQAKIRVVFSSLEITIFCFLPLKISCHFFPEITINSGYCSLQSSGEVFHPISLTIERAASLRAARYTV